MNLESARPTVSGPVDETVDTRITASPPQSGVGPDSFPSGSSPTAGSASGGSASGGSVGFSGDGDPHRNVELVTGTRPGFATELRDLLRSRLRIVALVLLLPTIFFVLRGFFWTTDAEVEGPLLQGYRLLVMLGLAVSAAVLWSPWHLSRRELRAIEMVLFGLPCALFFLSHHLALGSIAEPAHRDQIRFQVQTIAFLWFGLTIIYGLFIPNTWQRGLLIMALMTLAPILVVGLAGILHPEIGAVVFPDQFSVVCIVMLVAFGASLYGSDRIISLRREAFEARQLGQYQLTRRIGGGGMGDVYLAEHQFLKRPCAIKLIRPGQETNQRALRRFEREVRAIARLTHWNTVEIYDYGRADDGTFYYAMEYLPGLSLQQVVERQGPLPPERAVHLLRQVCRALSEAHRLGMVHRDIKPSNIIASQRGQVCDVAKLVDFGLALTRDEGVDVHVTQEGTVAGSPHYLAPERFVGDGDGDAASDIYGVGAVAYYLVTGKPPFCGAQPLEVMIAHARDPVMPPREVNPAIPVDLERVILNCLEKDPAQRYASAADLERALACCEAADHWTAEQAQLWWIDRDDRP